MKNRRIKIETAYSISVDYSLKKASRGYILSIDASAQDRYSTKPLPISRAFALQLFRLLSSSQVTPVTASDVIRDTFYEFLC